MPDKPFVINDRRKFTSEGELRPDVPHEEPKSSVIEMPAPPSAAPAEPEAPKGPQLVTDAPLGEAAGIDDSQLPPPPTAEQLEQAKRAYDATVERLDLAVRSMDPGGQHQPPMTFERMIQSLYLQALIQLGLTGDPNQPARVDLMGARSTIDMLGIVAEKSRSNLSDSESQLVDAALFELRLGFLDMTQALAQQAAAKGQTPGGGPSMPPPPGGPGLVR